MCGRWPTWNYFSFCQNSLGYIEQQKITNLHISINKKGYFLHCKIDRKSQSRKLTAYLRFHTLNGTACCVDLLSIIQYGSSIGVKLSSDCLFLKPLQCWRLNLPSQVNLWLTRNTDWKVHFRSFMCILKSGPLSGWSSSCHPSRLQRHSEKPFSDVTL